MGLGDSLSEKINKTTLRLNMDIKRSVDDKLNYNLTCKIRYKVSIDTKNPIISSIYRINRSKI